MPHLELLRTASFRLTVLFAAGFVGTVILVFLLVYFGATGVMWQEIRAEIDDERQALVEILEEAGIEALVAAVEERSQEADPDEIGYLLLDAAGARLAGGRPGLTGREGWFEFVPPDKDPDESFLALGAPLANGLLLVVAATTEHIHDLRESAWLGGLWSIGISVPLALLGGYLVSRMVLRRIAVITTATERIRAGNLTERVALRGTGDEFDTLAGHINRMLDSIAELTASMRQVTSDIAHDLRTPLGRLRQGLERVRALASGHCELESAIDRSIAEVDTVLTTFDALLRIGQIEAGTRRQAFRELDLSELLDELAQIYAPVVADSGRTLRHRIEPGLRVKGDRALLVQMISNLIENGVRHTPAGTTIDLCLARDGTGLCVSVGDDGPGIPDDERERVLRPFYRLDKSRESRGNGLGLGIVEAVAKLHHMTVTLHDNEPGLRVELHVPA